MTAAADAVTWAWVWQHEALAGGLLAFGAGTTILVVAGMEMSERRRAERRRRFEASVQILLTMGRLWALAGYRLSMSRPLLASGRPLEELLAQYEEIAARCAVLPAHTYYLGTNIAMVAQSAILLTQGIIAFMAEGEAVDVLLTSLRWDNFAMICYLKDIERLVGDEGEILEETPRNLTAEERERAAELGLTPEIARARYPFIAFDD